MSQAHQPHEESSTSVKTPTQLITLVTLGLAVPVLALGVLIGGVGKTRTVSEEERAAVAERIQPVGAVSIKAEGGPLRTGEEVYKAQCSGCHATGALGSPKFSDAGAWGSRIGAGFEALVNSALKGKGNMSPQGGGEFNDTEVARAVVFMANAGGAKFAEPAAPAASAN